MTWHLFALVWGEAFVERFGQLVVPFLAMPGNIPALVNSGPVTCRFYTDSASRGALEVACAPLASFCKVDVRLFDASVANGLRGPDYKYEIQRRCVQELARDVAGETIVLLDSNFVLADGALRFLSERRAEGYRAASVSALRVSTDSFARALHVIMHRNSSVGPRSLFEISQSAIHHITESFFVDAEAFTPYPSQMSWSVGRTGFVNRNFLPHPIMFPADDRVGLYQSTADYDLLLRTAEDREIYVCCDSDDVLAVKFSDDTHQAVRSGVFRPTVEDIGLFLLTSTNRRHRLFADKAVVFHSDQCDERHGAVIAESQRLIDAAYDWIDRIAQRPAGLDARMMMYLKSHFGPIEDFMSPQLEPHAFGRLP